MVKFQFYNWFIAFTSALGGFLFGYEIGIINQVFTMDSFNLFFGLKTYNSNGQLVPTPGEADITGWVTFVFLIGAAAGAAIVSYPADRIGRRWTTQLGGLVFVVGAAFQTASNGIALLYAGRFVAGVGIGIMSTVVPLYISETAASEIRGRLVAIYQLMITIGIFIASCVNSLIIAFYTKDDSEWRLAFGMQLIPATIMLLALFAIPLSPRWLVSRDRDEEGKKAISRLRSLPIDDAKVKDEYDEIKKAIEEEKKVGEAGWLELTKKGIRFRIFLGVMLQFFQQWTGINVILYYGASLFDALGLEGAGGSVAFVLVNNAINIIATLPGLYLIEKFGRRWLMIVGGVGIAVSHILVTVFGEVSRVNQPVGWGAIIFIFVFIIFFAFTWGPVVWAYQSEIFPMRIRSKGTSLSTVSNWATNAVVSKVAPLILQSISFYTYLIFGGFGVIMTIFVIALVPETKGKTLEELDEVFGDKSSKEATELHEVQVEDAKPAPSTTTNSSAVDTSTHSDTSSNAQ